MSDLRTSPPEASTTELGIIQLGGSLGGTSTSQTVPALDVTKRIGSLTVIGHSYTAGSTQNDSGTSMVYLESNISKLQSLLGIHEDNVNHLGQAGSRITSPTNPITASAFAGWCSALQFVLPNNSTNVNAAADVTVSDPVIATNGAGVIVHGANDFDLGIDGTANDNAVRQTAIQNAAKHAYRTIISRLRAGAVYALNTVAGVLTWDTSIAFSGGSDVASITKNTGSGYRSMTTNTNYVEITLPSYLPSSCTVAVNFIAQVNGTTHITSSPGTGTASITVASAADFPSSGTFVANIAAEGANTREEVLVTSGAGTTTWNITRAQNGTAASAHGANAVISIATDCHNVTWSTSGSNTNISGASATYISGQGCANKQQTVTKRFAVTGADAGKTIRATVANIITGDTSAAVEFDSWWIEAPNPNPIVVANLPYWNYGNTIYNNVSWISYWNTAITNAVAEFDSWVKVADTYTPFYNTAGTIGSTINNTDVTTTLTWTGNSSSFVPYVGLRMSFGKYLGEHVDVTAVTPSGGNAYSITITRGVAGTAKASHTSGDFLAPLKYMHIDDIHLTAQGHSVFAELMYSAFTSMTSPSTYQLAESQGNWSQGAQSFSMGVVDNYYLYPAVNVMGTAAQTLSKMQAHPIYIPKVAIITEIGVACTAVNASPCTFRFGIYFPDRTHSRPGNLIQEFGTVTSSVSANSGLTGCYQVLRPGWYWLAVVQQGGGGVSTVRTISTLGLSYPALMSDTALAALGMTGYSQTSVTGALPNAWTIPQGTETAGTPRIHVRLRSIMFA